MKRRIELQARGSKRLKGLDEFEKPKFVGRMEGVASDKREPRTEKIAALQNFVPAP